MALFCASYELGHNVHSLHAISARHDRRRPATITVADGVDLSLAVGDNTLRYRNHNAEQLLMLVAKSGRDLRLIEDWHLLVLSGTPSSQLFSLARRDDPWLPCEPVPDGPFPYPKRPPWGSREGERRRGWE